MTTMPTLEILDGFCFDHGYHLGFDCPRCTNGKAQASEGNQRPNQDNREDFAHDDSTL